MMNESNETLSRLIDQAVAGDRESLQALLLSVQDLVFRLSLRMLGAYPDAEDATQDILLKVMTRRLNPKQLDYTASGELETLQNVKSAMESIDEWSQELSFCMARRSPERLRQWVRQLLDSPALAIVKQVSTHPEGPGKEPDSAPPEGCALRQPIPIASPIHPH